MRQGYTGISFPFRVGNRGGVVMSSTNSRDVPHIIESIIQILGTSFKERVHNSEFGSEIDTQIFEHGDVTSHNFIKFQIMESLSLYEPRIEVNEEDITLFSENNKLYVEIKFLVIKYQSVFSKTIDLGGVVNEY